MAQPFAQPSPPAVSQNYGYGSDGLRAWKQVSGNTTYFLYDGDQPVCELNSSGAVSATNTWAGGLISRNSGGTSTFYTWDTSGNVVQRLDSSGNVLGTYAFDAYGIRTGTDNSTDPYATFGGEYGYYADSESGLELLGHRYYDSGTGRFINRDPTSYDGGADLYEYADDNPIMECDPSGNDPFLIHATTKDGVWTGQVYVMDIPHQYNSSTCNIFTLTLCFGKQIGKYPAALRRAEALNIFYRDNRDGAKYDFKVCKPKPPSSSDPNSLYDLRALGGNFLFGAEAARAGWPLSDALNGADEFRAAGSLKNNFKKVVGDIWNGTVPPGELSHPQDEQQAIIDGYNWWLRNGH